MVLNTEDLVRAAVVNSARGELGKHFGVGGVTPYGKWYGPGWDRAYFCIAGATWCWYMALGHADAHRTIGHQTVGGVAPMGRGFVWTVAFLEQHRSKRVALRDLKPGDVVMYRYNSGDNRQGNEVNHADIVEYNNVKAGYIDCIGFNVPKPGAPAGSDPGRGGGVWRRRTYYNNPFVVAGLQMPAKAIADYIRGQWSAIQLHLTALHLANLEGTGNVGPATMAGVGEYKKHYGYTGSSTDRIALLRHLEATMTNIMDKLSRIERRQHEYQTKNEHMLQRILDKPDPKFPSVKDIVNGIFSRASHGFSFDWWSRRGLITNPEHRNFPADPGSPADKELRREAAENDGVVKIYLPKGERTLRLDPETDKFI